MDQTTRPAGKTQRGAGGELHQQSVGEDRPTTNHGVPVSDNQNSLKAGAGGPSLLEDFVLREKIRHFDHERIPERIVHARGSGAHGYFELTESLADYTTARILTEGGEKTELFTRFSTVAGGADSVDTPRDVRGFAVKMYTKESNRDLVGNHNPVFFIQDAIKYPETLEGRTVGILVADGGDSAVVEKVKKAAIAAGAKPRVVGPKLNVKLDGGDPQPVDGQLAGTPSAIFDAVAIVLSEAGTKTLLNDGAAVDFAKDAFGHLKATAFAQPLLDKAGVEPDAGVFALPDADIDGFIAAAKTRQWDREPNVRLLA